MVYKPEVSRKHYDTVFTSKDILEIRVMEVLRLAEGGVPRKYRNLWYNNVESLRPREKARVYSYIIKKVSESKTARNRSREQLVKVPKGRENLPNKPIRFYSGQISELEDEIKLYDRQIIQLDRGAQYLRRFHDFPK
ncbi:hypothetical protein J4448_07285 [Candidatus Woesearchaeota archaeon]|nr:hypothetical protein [Candidatus Woesearchaeota archaeon]